MPDFISIFLGDAAAAIRRIVSVSGYAMGAVTPMIEAAA
jgi:hypothetical protein